MTGAIMLCSRAALRAGAGLVVAAVPASEQPVVAGLALEPMTLACPDLEGGARTGSGRRAAGAGPTGGGGLARPRLRPHERHGRARPADRAPDRGAAGAGRRRTPRRRHRPRPAPRPRGADGDHAAHRRGCGLLGVTTADLAAYRLASARTLAEWTGAVCVLKGADTIIAHPDGRLAVRDGDDPRLATAGTGDVLCGTIAGCWPGARRPSRPPRPARPPHLAAARSMPAGRALVASDLIDRLPLGG